MPRRHVGRGAGGDAESPDAPNQERDPWQRPHPQPAARKGTQRLDAELKETGKGDCQHHGLHGDERVNRWLWKVLGLERNEDITPFVERMGEAKSGQPAQTARQRQPAVSP